MHAHTHTLADQVSLDAVSAHGDSGPAKCHSTLMGVALRGCQERHNELSARCFPPLYCCRFSSGSCWRLPWLIPPWNPNQVCCAAQLLWSSVVCLLRLVAVPLSRCLGVKERVRIRAAANPKLENFYKRNSRQPSQVCNTSSSSFDLIKEAIKTCLACCPFGINEFGHSARWIISVHWQWKALAAGALWVFTGKTRKPSKLCH